MDITVLNSYPWMTEICIGLPDTKVERIYCLDRRVIENHYVIKCVKDMDLVSIRCEGMLNNVEFNLCSSQH